ncbi:hypothetical protein EES41_40900 (plasmid) [Streptomyces sp. ADI95-16]|nr:hypothetical protein EES41_40900 [Streptomyces sp. ADI95-16]
MENEKNLVMETVLEDSTTSTSRPSSARARTSATREASFVTRPVVRKDTGRVGLFTLNFPDR